MRPTELAPVKHSLPVLGSPGTDHRDMAHTVQRWQSADTQQQVVNYYCSRSNKAQNEGKRSHSWVGEDREVVTLLQKQSKKCLVDGKNKINKTIVCRDLYSLFQKKSHSS